jgi:transcriptional regulator with XRE-family HTH domain
MTKRHWTIEEEQGVLIASARVMAGLTQKELGELADVSAATISKIERGEVKAHRDTIKQIRAVLKERFEITHTYDSANHVILATRKFQPLDDWT